MVTFKFTNPGFNSDHQKVVNFQEEDTLEITGLPGLRSNPTFLLGEKKSDFEGLKRSGADLIYILEDGRLFYNPNGVAMVSDLRMNRVFYSTLFAVSQG